jgi:membrane protein YqaA with SNARE-associated domain
MTDAGPSAAWTEEQDQPEGVPPPPPRWRLRVVQILTIVIVVTAMALAVYFRDKVQELEQYGYAAVFVIGLVSNATIVLPVPGLAVSSVMGGVLNPWAVGAVGGVSQALGEMTGYMAGYSGTTWIDENRTYNRIARWMQRHGMLTVFVMAVIPNPVFDVGGMAAGALRFPAWKFLVACTAGKVIKNIAFALAGFYGIEALYRLLGG